MKNLMITELTDLPQNIKDILIQQKHSKISLDQFQSRRITLDDIYILTLENDDIEEKKIFSDTIVLIKGNQGKQKVLAQDCLAAFDYEDPMDQKNFIKLFKYFKQHLFTSFFKDELLELNLQLKQTRHLLDIELQRIKIIHEELAPSRFKQFKNVDIASRYISGESVGGEFFDVLEVGKTILLYLAASKDYMSSTSIMTQFLNFKKMGVIDETAINNFLMDLISELSLLGQDSLATTQVFLATLDITSMDLTGYNFSKTILLNGQSFAKIPEYNLSREKLNQPHFKIKLNRDEKTFILSPGFCHNWHNKEESLKYHEVIDHQRALHEDLNEFIFQIKKDYLDEFMPYDATIVGLGVKKNALIGY